MSTGRFPFRFQLEPAVVPIVLKGAQDLPQQLLSTLHGFIAAKARNFEMLILKYFNLNSFPTKVTFSRNVSGLVLSI
jgi:hypothetical protein